MTTQNMQANTALSSKLGEFFVDQLKDIYWAEKKLVKTLPKLEEAATSPKLKQAFGEHLVQTQTHVSRLENIFEMIGQEAEATKCPAMAGIVDEGEEIIDETREGSSQRDAGLIFAGQKAEHYEIATYGGLSQIAETLGFRDVANILNETLSEEKQADILLTEIAEGGVNERASQESREDE
jgi:ferritin-like metal-binding protein YciE